LAADNEQEVAMSRVKLEKEWLAAELRPEYEVAVDRALQERGMSTTRTDRGLEIRGGSQMKMRALGGWLSRDSLLPRAGTLERSPAPHAAGLERISLRLEDRMGFGVMDHVMRKKYERVLADVAISIEGALRAHTTQLTLAPAD
jgi:hypothetical protein